MPFFEPRFRGGGIVTLGALETPSCGNKRTKINPNPRSFSRHPPADHSTPVTVVPVPLCVRPPATRQATRCSTIFGSSLDQDQYLDDSPLCDRLDAAAAIHRPSFEPLSPVLISPFPIGSSNACTTLALPKCSACLRQFRLLTGIVMPENFAISSLGKVT